MVLVFTVFPEIPAAFLFQISEPTCISLFTKKEKLMNYKKLNDNPQEI
jgi:hypothetical protein